MLECIAIITKNQGSLSTVVGDEKLTSREDRIGPLFMYVQCDEDTFLKVDEVSKTEAQAFDVFDQLISSFHFCGGKVCFLCILDVLLVSKKNPKDRLKIVIDLASIFLYQVKELTYSLLLKVKKQKLIKCIVVSKLF